MSKFKLWLDITGVILDIICAILQFATGNIVWGILWSFCAIVSVNITISDIKIRKENKK